MVMGFWNTAHLTASNCPGGGLPRLSGPFPRHGRGRSHWPCGRWPLGWGAVAKIGDNKSGSFFDYNATHDHQILRLCLCFPPGLPKSSVLSPDPLNKSTGKNPSNWTHNKQPGNPPIHPQDPSHSNTTYVSPQRWQELLGRFYGRLLALKGDAGSLEAHDNFFWVIFWWRLWLWLWLLLLLWQLWQRYVCFGIVMEFVKHFKGWRTRWIKKRGVGDHVKWSFVRIELCANSWSYRHAPPRKLPTVNPRWDCAICVWMQETGRFRPPDGTKVPIIWISQHVRCFQVGWCIIYRISVGDSPLLPPPTTVEPGVRRLPWWWWWTGPFWLVAGGDLEFDTLVRCRNMYHFSMIKKHMEL